MKSSRSAIPARASRLPTGETTGPDGVSFPAHNWILTGIIHSERRLMTLASRGTQQRRSGLIHPEIGFVHIYSGGPHKTLSPEFSGNYT